MKDWYVPRWNWNWIEDSVSLSLSLCESNWKSVWIEGILGLGLVWWTEAEAEAEAERLSRGFKAKPTGKWERKGKPSADWRRSITHCTLYVSNLFAKVAFYYYYYFLNRVWFQSARWHFFFIIYIYIYRRLSSSYTWIIYSIYS